MEALKAFLANVLAEPALSSAFSRYDWSQLDIRNAHSFKWQRSVTPLSDIKFVIATWVIYWTVVWGLGNVMSTRDALTLKSVAALHNAILTLWSAIMAVMLAFAIYEQYTTHGVRALFCADGDAQVHPKMHYWLYIFYVSKFYELLDTVILRLKKRDLILLHWFHHTVVIAMTWSWVHFRMNFACLGMLANTIVHVFMYSYYFCSVLKINVWFKKYITTMQLVQFALSFVASVYYVRYANDGRGCYGNSFGPFEFTLACNISFFFLFAMFYVKSYSGKQAAKKKD
eukprot:m.78738 g.78738  ORF g.78738 m.78738 type:complete len:285 (+) comp10740_c0_seq2:53-907(+)